MRNYAILDSATVEGDARVLGNAEVVGDVSVSPEGGRGGIWLVIMKDGSTRHIEGVDLNSALQDAQLADVPCWHVKSIVRVL